MFSRYEVALAEGVLVEKLGAECVVFVPGSTDVLTLRGEMATVVVGLQAGEPVSASDPGVAQLVDLGVVTAPTGLTRRRVLTAGAVGVGAGLAALAMPSIAAASSPSGGGGSNNLFGVVDSSFAGFAEETPNASAFAINVGARFGATPWAAATAQDGSPLTISQLTVGNFPALPFSQLYNQSGSVFQRAEWRITQGLTFPVPFATFRDQSGATQNQSGTWQVQGSFTVDNQPYSVTIEFPTP